MAKAGGTDLEPFRFFLADQSLAQLRHLEDCIHHHYCSVTYSGITCAFSAPCLPSSLLYEESKEKERAARERNKLLS